MVTNARTNQLIHSRRRSCFSQPSFLRNSHREDLRETEVANNRLLGHHVWMGGRGHVNCDDDGRE